MKTKLTYFLFFVCFSGLCFTSFHATFKLLKQSISASLTEADIDDLEEDETEKNEIEEDAKLISEKSNLNFLYGQQCQLYSKQIDANSVSMFQNIQSPPPKI